MATPKETSFPRILLQVVIPGNTLRSDEDRLKLDELMALFWDASKQGRIDAIDADEEITLVSVQNVDEEMFDVNVLDEVVKVINSAKLITDAAQVSAASNVVSTVGDATTVSSATTTTATITTVDDITLAQALMEIKSTKSKEKGVVIQEMGESTTTISSQLSSQQSQDKAEFDEEERLAREKAEKEKEANIALIETWDDIHAKIDVDHQLVERLQAQEQEELIQAEFDEEERLAREKAEKEKEANIALIETWDDIRAKIDVDHQLAERLQAQEQEELSIKEKATLFQKLLDKRRKHFTAKRAEEKRNKPPTKAQQRKIMCTYLKSMEGYKLKDLKFKEFDSIQEMFDKAFKKQKVEDDKETTELKQCLEIILDEEEVTIDAIPLVVKSPSIVDWKIYKEGRKSYYQIMRADGKSQTYMIFSQMLKSFDRQDLEDLYKLVKAKYESTRPVEDLDLLLWGDLKTMFEPHVEDKVWRNQQEYKVLDWKLYDSCGVHSLRMQHMQIYMLVEKKYPLAPLTLSMMLEKKLIIDYESEMAYQLLKFIIKQLKNESLTAELERYKERVKTFEQRLNIDLSSREKLIGSQMDDMIWDRRALKQQIDSLEQNLFNQIKEKESLLQTFDVFKKESKEKENFGKRFVPQQELSAEQAFWLQTLHPNTDQSDISPVKIEAPKELPKVSLVNTSLQKLKYHLGNFDIVVKKRITPDAIIEGSWGFEHTKAIFLNELSLGFVPVLRDQKDNMLNSIPTSDVQSAGDNDKYNGKEA
ncbi:hypothetical protein Tco_0005086 [Tanacetum coccineum]